MIDDENNDEDLLLLDANGKNELDIVETNGLSIKRKNKKTKREDEVENGKDTNEMKEDFLKFRLKKLLSRLDLVLVNSDLKIDKLKEDCEQAVKFGFNSVTVFPQIVPNIRKYLSKSNVKPQTVAGYPYGEHFSRVKCYEIKDAISIGADEITAVVARSCILLENYKYLKKDAEKMQRACGDYNANISLDISGVDEKKLKKICDALTAVKIAYVQIFALDVDAEFLKTAYFMIKNLKKSKLIVAGNIGDIEKCKKLFDIGVERIATPYAVSLAKDFSNEKL